MKNTRSSILMSVLALTLCIAMLVGSTFAWFTDSVKSNGNIIKSGTIDVDMQWTDDLTQDNWGDASEVSIFNYNKWEPGYTDVKYVKVINKGNLNLKWKLYIEATGTVTKLSDVIDVYYVNPMNVEGGNITTLEGLTLAGNLTKVLAEQVNSTGSLTPTQETVVAIVFHMQETAGNEYQDLSLCEGGFAVKLVATQEVGESDSFGSDYDADANWGDGSVNYAASANIDENIMQYGALTTALTIGTSDGINATIPQDVKIAEGATKLDLTVKTVDVDSNISLGEGESAKSLDVHIDGISPDNTKPMTINLGKLFDAGLSDEEVKLYHTENGVANPMTRVASAADFAIHNQFTYDSATGEVAIYIASFSVITGAVEKVSIWNGSIDTSWYDASKTEFVINTAAEFAGFRAIVDGGYYDSEWTWVEVTQDSFVEKTIKLGTNIDLDKRLFDPIGKGYVHNGGKAFMGIFDGQGRTIFNLYQNGWDLDPDKKDYSNYTYSTAGGGLFASIKDATIKNLTMSGAEIVFECVDMGIVAGYAQGRCTFENITVTNSIIANYNRYTGGVVGEVCKAEGDGYTHVFRNIVVDSSVVVSSLWGSFDTSCGGIIGGKWGDAKVLIENAMVACRMDVFCDVTAAYQWYAYRRCGMLIGNTEQSDTSNAHLAAAYFLTCNKVDVYYGDWVKYTYCLFTNQDNTWCNNYPWVRVQAGEHNNALSNPRYGVPVIKGEQVAVGHEASFHQEGDTHELIIEFNQLYGGGQGVYGRADHNGVRTHDTIGNTNSKIIYIDNTKDWSDLSLKYYLKDDATGDEWTTISDAGISLKGMETSNYNIYRIVLPYYAYSVQIIGNGGEKTTIKLVSELTEGKTYTLDWIEPGNGGVIEGGGL